MLEKIHFYHVSHIFLGSKQILLQRIKIYKHKETKIKTKKNQNHKTNRERGIEIEREIKWQRKRSVRGWLGGGDGSGGMDMVDRSKGGGLI